MKTVVIADDLTGACDTGVQFAGLGLNVSLWLDPNGDAHPDAGHEVIVLDTDSRASDPAEAYRRTAAAARFAKGLGADCVYKKLDSTLRGNLGAELDAVYDELQPDFVLAAPAYPKMGRTVKEGRLYVHGIPLHETEFARDPRTPVRSSVIADILRGQTQRDSGLVPAALWRDGGGEAESLLRSFARRGIRYLIADAEEDGDLARMAEVLSRLPYAIVWAGSAGLAGELPIRRPESRGGFELPAADGPVLAVVGSVHPSARRQLALLLEREDVRGIPLVSSRLLFPGREREEQVASAAGQAARILGEGHHAVLFSAADPEEIRRTQEAGRCGGMDDRAAGAAIAEAIGEAAARVAGLVRVGRLILTGGDTARHVSTSLGASEIQLLGEVESGVPIGLLRTGHPLTVVTKAGGFGTDGVLVRALEYGRGERRNL
ncbi:MULTISPECIES: four-carbon acid sugar kinase family protein [Paenibacillus]|uniref:four-carbon acid sugar kinase family protein n=1 Tax=Paenibacillus TaxID=44249 RepID=UPI0022B8A9D0|nr:four-carbon acid sugar kinase family protein [Paenibacillus caseinilyticus]MCZ8519548.1 four-carbon acid sugar kinase family protein [Paenibacillus caseinilyticus]